MALADIYNAANDALFQGRCMAALWKAAQNVINEDPGTANHLERKNFALRVLRDEQRVTPRQVAMQVLRNATIAANPGASTDNDIEFVINSYWSDLMEIG